MLVFPSRPPIPSNGFYLITLARFQYHTPLTFIVSIWLRAGSA